MKRVVLVLLAAVAVWFDSFAARTLLAQAPAAADAASESVWQGVYTTAQATRGQASYRQSCSRCHAVDAEGVARRFTGDRFWAAWGEAPLDRLYGYLRRSMPNDAPGTLSDATYADITAFLLRGNGIPAGDRELRAESVGSILLAVRNSNGTLPDGAFVSVSGCLVKDGEGWTVTHAGPPSRLNSSVPAPAPVVAADQLGDDTFRLLLVISPLDAMLEHQVRVLGMLVRRPTAAVNVMTVESMAPSCAAPAAHAVESPR
jgi:mono/diheme cytochrome c family protein